MLQFSTLATKSQKLPIILFQIDCSIKILNHKKFLIIISSKMSLEKKRLFDNNKKKIDLKKKEK